MNALLIHNDNLPHDVLNFFGKQQLKFDIQSSHVIQHNFTFDNYASHELEFVLKRENYEVIYVVLNLNKNDFLEFTALSIINHIRLTQNWNHTNTPIVVLSPLSIEEVTRISDNYEVLYSPGVFYETEYSKDAVERINRIIKNTFRVGEANLLNEVDYQKFLQTIRIKPPGHFDSQHSIDNELTLYHWSKAIGIENIEIQNEIETSLYFKYIKATNPIISIENNQIIKIKENCSVLLIDDQWERGWVRFYEQFFNSPAEQFFYVEINKGNDFNKIKTAVEEKIKLFDPDVILLDLRLTDNDFKKEILVDELSGYLLLKYLNSNFPGIQVVITSASTKASTYEKTIRWAHSYIQKSLNFGIQEVIDKIYNNLQSSIYIARQIKEFIVLVNKIKSVLKTSDFDDEFKESILCHLELAYEIFILFLKSKQQRYIELTYLELYFIIEDFCQNSNIFNEDIYCTVYANQIEYCVVQYYKKHKDKKPAQGTSAILYKGGHYVKGQSIIDRNLDTNFKVSAILLYRYGLGTSGEMKWTKLNKLRNTEAGHSKNKNSSIESVESVCQIDKTYLVDILKLIEFLLDDNNIHKERVDGAFDIGEDKINMLMETHNTNKKYKK